MARAALPLEGQRRHISPRTEDRCRCVEECDAQPCKHIDGTTLVSCFSCKCGRGSERDESSHCPTQQLGVWISIRGWRAAAEARRNKSVVREHGAHRARARSPAEVRASLGRRRCAQRVLTPLSDEAKTRRSRGIREGKAAAPAAKRCVAHDLLRRVADTKREVDGRGGSEGASLAEHRGGLGDEECGSTGEGEWGISTFEQRGAAE